MNSIQIVLTIVVIYLTILLIGVGVQVLLVIMEMRRSVRRLNTILEDSILGGGLIRPDKLTNVLDFFRKKKNNQDEGQKI